MTGSKRTVETVFRGIGLVGGLLVAVGIVVFAVGGARAVYEADLSPVSVPITTNQMELLLLGGGGAFLVGAALNIVGNVSARFVATTRESGADVDLDNDAAAARELPTSERYRRSLGRTYLSLSILILALVTLAGAGGAIPDPAGELTQAIAAISVRILFGSIAGAMLSALVLGGLWYGIKQRSAEALLAGLVIAALFVVSTIQYSAFGLTVAGLLLVYYSVMARKAVTFRLTDASAFPDHVRRFVE